MKGIFVKIQDYTKRIPKGKVTTYGEISDRLRINNPRIVGWAMHANKDKNIPCHRVVNKEGKVSDSYAFDGWETQKAKLVKEGVGFISEKSVDLSKYLWNPKS